MKQLFLEYRYNEGGMGRQRFIPLSLRKDDMPNPEKRVSGAKRRVSRETRHLRILVWDLCQLWLALEGGRHLDQAERLAIHARMMEALDEVP